MPVQYLGILKVLVLHTKLKMQPIFFCLFFGLFFVSVSARSQETHLMIQNFSKEDIITTIVSGVDSFDFEDGNGPIERFQNKAIPSGATVETRMEVNYYASNCPFTMTFWFEDNSSAWYRINQKYAIGEAEAGFSTAGTRKISYSKTGITIVISIFDK
ncbi:hypothetical protein Zmor_015147 [Zophobas morio]|uniref:Uncharacterized protein n=1 Tax=Zophobas morio TaxID=2755281 RepID=A0AA38IJI9_9CUCU|nr:hypothetical protein Zmor_015147 [Zophobas morio]